MPFTVTKDEKACSASKPWAVKTKGTGKVHGCHASKADAKKQQAALYANDAAAASYGEELERLHLSAPAPVVALATEIKLSEPEVTYDSDGMVLARMKDVPLLEVGMAFPASTGPVAFGVGHLEAAVASCADPTLPRPRIKLGHTDPRYNDTKCPHCQEDIKAVLDGEVALGFIENTHIDGPVVYGDLVDVPLWLCKIAPVAWPSRSVEGWKNWDNPLNAKHYDFCLTAVALLGVMYPGVLSLGDLPQLYGSEMPDYVVLQEAA